VDARGIHGITPLETAIYHASRASSRCLRRPSWSPTGRPRRSTCARRPERTS
jgi:hypothetical protein